MHTLRGHKQPVQRIAICGSRLYSTAGRDIRVWDVATFECLQVIRTQQDCGALLAMTAAPDGTVYVGGQVCSPAILSAPLIGSKWLGWAALHCVQLALTGCSSTEQASAVLLLCKYTAFVQGICGQCLLVWLLVHSILYCYRQHAAWLSCCLLVGSSCTQVFGEACFPGPLFVPAGHACASLHMRQH